VTKPVTSFIQYLCSFQAKQQQVFPWAKI